MNQQELIDDYLLFIEAIWGCANVCCQDMMDAEDVKYQIEQKIEQLKKLKENV